MKKYLLNSTVLTSFGTWEYALISVEEAKKFVASEFISAIGHPATAEFLSELLATEITANRCQIDMNIGDEALVFKILPRAKNEGQVFDKVELSKTQWTLGLLKRIS